MIFFQTFFIFRLFEEFLFSIYPNILIIDLHMSEGTNAKIIRTIHQRYDPYKAENRHKMVT